MKLIALIAGILLGLLFAFASLAYFFNWVSGDPPAPGSASEHFFAAFYPTGYLDFVKALELAGAVLVAIPATRRVGLLVLGPIIVNIVAFHVLVAREGFANPLLIATVVLPLLLVWVERRAFITFIRGSAAAD